ncbi:SpoIIE family protein phosphatase [Streptomyces sp. NPDC050743]|uniref:SpoIIE family protein phosphatase n=1 Tax=Streptomyces sp. NPDC050743 TaxID=3365634 RepID=UPI0037BC642B
MVVRDQGSGDPGARPTARRPPRTHPPPQANTTYTPSDTLILYTDGLIERRDEDMDTGLTCLTSTLATCTGFGAEHPRRRPPPPPGPHQRHRRRHRHRRRPPGTNNPTIPITPDAVITVSVRPWGQTVGPVRSHGGPGSPPRQHSRERQGFVTMPVTQQLPIPRPLTSSRTPPAPPPSTPRTGRPRHTTPSPSPSNPKKDVCAGPSKRARSPPAPATPPT